MKPGITVRWRRSEVAELNRIVSEYLKRLGMREEAKLEFMSKANSMISLDSYRSGWFHRITAQLYKILHQIQLPPPDIDLNEPPPPQHTKVGEEGGSSSLNGNVKGPLLTLLHCASVRATFVPSTSITTKFRCFYCPTRTQTPTET